MNLADIREELIDSIQDKLSILLEPVTMAQAGPELEEAASCFQSLAICNLLLFADADRFHENLVKAAHTRRYFLTRSAKEGNTDPTQLAISRWDAFLAALVPGHFALAMEIVALSTDQWLPDGEYEDDFCYRNVLHQLVMPPSPLRDAQLQAGLQGWHTWLQGQPSARLACCTALVSGDSTGFNTAVDQLIAQRQAELAEQRCTVRAADINFHPNAEVFIEGLALLKLAERLNFSPKPDCPLCPTLARHAPTRSLPDDLFEELDAEREKGQDNDSE